METDGLAGFTNALTTTVTSQNLWNEVAKAAPFIGAMILVAVGVYIVRRAIGKATKLKAGI